MTYIFFCLISMPTPMPTQQTVHKKNNFCRGHATYKSPCRSVGWSVGRSVHHTSLFFAFLGILRVGKFMFEHAPAQVVAAPS